MKFVFDECAVFHAKKGKVQDPEIGLEIMGNTVIQDLVLRISRKTWAYSKSSVTQTQLLENLWERRSCPE
jgi:hypothetical protein